MLKYSERNQNLVMMNQVLGADGRKVMPQRVRSELKINNSFVYKSDYLEFITNYLILCKLFKTAVLNGN